MPFLEDGQLPTPTTKGFGLLMLPAPWSGAERPESRALASKISAGPLISVDELDDEAQSDASEEPLSNEGSEAGGCLKFAALLMLPVLLLLAAAGLEHCT